MKPPKNRRSAVITLKTAQQGYCAGLRAGIRHALDFSRVPKSGFVEQQIARHREFHSRQESKAEVQSRLQSALDQLRTIASSQEWSQRELAGKLGIRESTFRFIKRGLADPDFWLPRLEAAVARLQQA